MNIQPERQFVVLEHKTAAERHWDLMLENDGKLWTWRLENHPAEIHSLAAAERIFDHPLKFLTYEGPVQNGAGSVTVADKGVLCFRRIADDAITCELNGEILKGLFDLRLQHAPLWTFTRHRD